MRWQVTLLALCSIVKWTQQITSQHTYGQLLNKQLYGSNGAKPSFLQPYSTQQTMLGQFTSQHPGLSQYNIQHPGLGQYGNHQANQFHTQHPNFVSQYSNPHQLAQFSKQQALLASYSNQQPIFAHHPPQPMLAQHSFTSQPSLTQINNQQLQLAQHQQALLQQYNNVQSNTNKISSLMAYQKQLLGQKTAQKPAHRVRTRLAGKYPYNPLYGVNKSVPQVYRPQQKPVVQSTVHGQALFKSALKGISIPGKEGYRFPASEATITSSPYPFYQATSSQSNKLTAQQPFKFASPPHTNILNANFPTQSFANYPIQSQSAVTSTYAPVILGSTQQPVVDTNKYNVPSINYNYNTLPQNNHVFKSSNQQHSASYPVKSEGERGPIHTIPAPNLSLSDKPIVVPDFNTHSDNSFLQHSKKKVPQSYEVIEETKDWTFKNPYTGESKLYAPDPQTKLSQQPPSNQYSSIVKRPYSQDSAFKVQSVTPSLTSQELYNLLNVGSSQQQLADTYNYPLLQQPQLQNYFLQQTLDTSDALQPFKAVVQQDQGDGSDSQQSVMFKPDPNYIKKIQDQYSKHTSDFHPNYQTFNYEEPTGSKGLETLHTELLKANLDKVVNEDFNHYNIRNSKDGSFGINNENSNKTEVSKAVHMEASVNFSPEENGFESGSHATSYFTQVTDPHSGSVATNFYSSQPNSNVVNTLLSVQNANEPQERSINSDSNHVQYFSQSHPKSMQYLFDSDSDSGFTPIKSSLVAVNPDDTTFDGQAPLRIYIPEQYDDIETQPSENIRVSASLAANQNDGQGIGSVHTESNQEYEDYTQLQKSETDNNGVSTNTAENSVTSEKPTESYPNDIFVTVKNETNPTLEILTKDWKTSIEVKPTEKNVLVEHNEFSDYGKKLKS